MNRWFCSPLPHQRSYQPIRIIVENLFRARYTESAFIFKFVYVPFRGFLFVGGKISMENKSNGKMHPFVKGLIVGVICMSLVTLVYAIIFILPQIMGH